MAERVEPPLEELDELQDESVSSITKALDRMAIAILQQDASAFRAAAEDYAGQITRAQQLSDLLGRRRLLLEADAKGERPSPRSFALRSWRSFAAAPWVSPVTFQEAITSLLEREPRLAAGWQAVQEAYTVENAFVLARSASEVLTERIQLAIARTMARQEAASESDAVRLLLSIAEEEGAPFTHGYAQVVYRTNLTTAYTAGRMRQARAPEVRAVTPGFRFDAVGDADTRDNHFAADGLVAFQDDPIWQTLSPPLGYNCRCVLALATAAEVREAQRTGRIRSDGRARRPRGAAPDEGFTKLGRTDSVVYPAGPSL